MIDSTDGVECDGNMLDFFATFLCVQELEFFLALMITITLRARISNAK